MDDFTATVTAQMVDTNGYTNIFSGIVERDGDFWVEGLPVGSGTNVWTLTVTDAAGNVAQTNIAVSPGDAGLTIDPVSDPNQLWNPTITVSGTISNTTDYTVWVNGMKAAINTDGTWIATNVPLPSGGTAVIQARAIPNSENGGNGTGGSGGGPVSYENLGNPSATAEQDAESPPDRPSRLFMASYIVQPFVDDDKSQYNLQGSPGNYSQTLEENAKWTVNWKDNGPGNSWGKGDMNGLNYSSDQQSGSCGDSTSSTSDSYTISWPSGTGNGSVLDIGISGVGG